MILATLDVSSLYTNIPQEEGINIVCRYYEEHYEQKFPIPTSDLRELTRLILEENSFKFNEKHFLQTLLIKGEALHLLKTNSVKENFNKYKRDFKQRLCNRGNPTTLVHKILTEVQFSDRTEALRIKTKEAK